MQCYVVVVSHMCHHTLSQTLFTLQKGYPSWHSLHRSCLALSAPVSEEQRVELDIFLIANLSPSVSPANRLPNLLSSTSASLLRACMYGWSLGYRPPGSRVKIQCWVGVLLTFRLHLMHLPTQSQPIPRPHALPRWGFWVYWSPNVQFLDHAGEK